MDEVMVNSIPLVEADRIAGRCYCYGTTALGSAAFYIPQKVIRKGTEILIVGKEQNFYREIHRTKSDYLKDRQHPYQKVGLYDFHPEDISPNFNLVRACNGSRWAASEIERLRARVAELEQEQ